MQKSSDDNGEDITYCELVILEVLVCILQVLLHQLIARTGYVYYLRRVI